MIDDKFLKPYDPAATEGRIYGEWEESGFFNPDNLPGDRKGAFTIVLPPPNVTGILHMGSALMVVIEDILIRHARMAGKKALWIPGTDSAAIATQARVEKDIQKKEGKSRHDLGREALLERIDAFVEENKETILRQLRSMGASLDWSRYAYTMDAPRYKAVMEAFVRMYDAGLVYRGNRVVNWDPKGQTVISDDEIEHEERDATLYTFRYWKDFPIAISTTRPETKVGDTAVAVHPEDPRYKEFVGETFTGEFAGTMLTIKVVADHAVEQEFGTGALGVTPAHSHADWDIAERNDLPRIQVIDERARMTDAAGPLLASLKVAEARERVAEWLRAEGLMEAEEKIKQNLSVAQRTGGTVEPLPKLQWFISVDKPFTIPYSEIPGIQSGSEVTLKEIMRAATESGSVTMLPERFETIYRHWVDNLRPWCISRQIWFGHRIPIWYRGDELYCGVEAPEGNGWEQDPDVLDTWFSSALWTFSTLGWPDAADDLTRFHPTTVLETGYDILPFWVARMILMSGFHLGQVPFRTVYFHGLVRDGKGQKISKSLGNNIDPVEMAAKYGTDAVRMSLVAGTAAGADSKVSEEKIKAYKNFANKLWNIARYVLTETEGADLSASLKEADVALRAEFDALASEATGDLEAFRIHLAVEKIYQYAWHRLADEILEDSKKVFAGDDEGAKASRRALLRSLLADLLALLHPFMPFVTEEIWKSLKPAQGMLMVAPWPSPRA